MIKKAPEPVEAAPVRGGGGIPGRNRVIPTAASQPAPVLRNGSNGSIPSNNEATSAPSGLRR